MHVSERGVVVTCLIAVVAFVGYIYYEMTNLPGDAVDSAHQLEQKIQSTKTKLASVEEKYQQEQASESWSFFSAYAEREQWVDSFKKAEKDISASEVIFAEDITEILNLNKKTELDRLYKKMAQASIMLKRADIAMRAPFERMKVLLEAKRGSDGQLDDASKSAVATGEGVQALKVRAETQSKVKHPAKADDIDQKVAEAITRQESQLALLGKMKAEIARKDTNYAVYADTRSEFIAGDKRLRVYLGEVKKKLDELDQSYVKVLSDQKIEYWVVVKRSSWCEWDGCFGENTYTYNPVRVDEATFEYFDSLNVSTAATLRRVYIDASKWAALRINKKERMPRSDDYAEFWIEKTYAKPYHKYTIIKNGNVIEQPFVQVDEGYFWKHHEDLGMAIVSKPYGFYESEKIESAEPVGLAMVAEPTMMGGRPTGSNQYGEWRTENGNSFWHYYGMYSFFGNMMGSGHRYHYDDWNSYRGRSYGSPYYGRNNEWGTYGSSTYRNERYRNSSFAKRNPSVMTTVSTKRNSKVASSVRSAGSMTRSRGPSGGGK